MRKRKLAVALAIALTKRASRAKKQAESYCSVNILTILAQLSAFMRKVSVSPISDISALGLYMNVLVSKILGMRNLLVIPFLVANDADPAACVNRILEAGGICGCGAGHHGGMLR